MNSLLLVVLLAGTPGQATAATPEAALAAFKAAFEAGDVPALAPLAAGELGEVLRKLVGPWAKAKAANDRLDQVLRGKPELNLKNPFAGGFLPLQGMEFGVVEITKDRGKLVARIRYGPRGKAQEEPVGLHQESGLWRVDLPEQLASGLRRIKSPALLEARAAGLSGLAEALQQTAADIEAGKLKTREDILARLAVLFAEKDLGRLLGDGNAK